MAYFIKNLMHKGESNNFNSYENVTIEYFSSKSDLIDYVDFLEERNWKAIQYTNSLYDRDPIEGLSSFCSDNAHDVIGQEFEKVICVMDDNFYYDENGKLKTSENYYSARGMLYEIVTRVINELKIIVLKNPKLYYQLLQIKNGL